MLKHLVLPLLSLYMAIPLATAEDAKPQPNLDGTWLCDRYILGTLSQMPIASTTVLTIKGDTFTATNVYGSKDNFTGSFSLDPAKKYIDLTLNAFDLKSIGMPIALEPWHHSGSVRVRSRHPEASHGVQA